MLLSITNLGTSEFILQDPSGESSFSVSVDGSSTKSGIAVSPELYGHIEAALKAAVSAGRITYALSNDPASSADDLFPTGPAGGDLAGTYPNPTIGLLKVTDAKVAAANKDGVAGTPSMRTLGTGATQACAGNDARLSDSRAPSGSAGGDLSGTYPSPTVASGAITFAKAKAFVSAEQTATGSAQNIAHGLAATPAAVLVVPTAGHDGAGSAGTQMPTITEGAHDGTDVIATVTAGAKFKVLAWA